MGADRGCECVGYQCHDPAGHEVPNLTMNALVKSVRPTGWNRGRGRLRAARTSKPPTSSTRKGQIAFDLGNSSGRGQHMGTGQANVKAYNRYLCELIHAGRANPSWIVSHELTLDEAPRAYKHFDCRDEGWTKVLLHPDRQKVEQVAIRTARRAGALSPCRIPRRRGDPPIGLTWRHGMADEGIGRYRRIIGGGAPSPRKTRRQVGPALVAVPDSGRQSHSRMRTSNAPTAAPGTAPG